MTIIQGLLATISTGAGGGGPPPYAGTEFAWFGDQDAWSALGGFQSNSVFSNPAPANPAYTYPDNSYTGKTRNFTGLEWMISMNLGGFANAWTTNTIGINFWFYPTANNVQLMSELDQQNDGLSSFHYSVLEISSTGNIKARFWQSTTPGQVITSTNTVILNQWNHIYFAEDSQGGHLFELNGVATNSQIYYTRATPGSNTEYFAIGISDPQSMVTTGRFQGKIGYLTIADYVNGSTYSATVNRFGPRSLSFSPSSTSYIVAQNTQSDWNLGTTWTIEWWSKATAATTGNGLYTVMCQAIDGTIDLLYQDGSLKLNNNTILFEPTPGVWTHVALVGTGSQVIAYYNGTSAGVLGGAINLNNSSNDLVIGRRGPGTFQYFDGKLAMIRISSTAKYSGTQFTPSRSYDVESDTRLMLGSTTPLVDSTGNHPINNQGAVVSTDFPV